ncbi:hypothetical protein GCM10012288_12010 [Malaciobacter pacificus]|uniref:Uncharacterized protein n=1 Tax=Malaciobacter pacificus TaxID=1080223 RepID=A0A5C2H5V4_9BACT|nr:hypothetical protein [Malaciobacter pacificus]QEP34193.1 hypothetical protein APAC_1067 [Malaciobacter pacificus]GGD39583.1 hypothetical protein GCM10012288_12010 [Malaciobacter pacificus]
MSKQVTFHINNMAYTVNLDEEVLEHLTKYLNLDKNNDTKELLAAYIRLSHEYKTFKKDVEQITDKLSRF